LTSAVAVGRAVHALAAHRIALVSPYSDAVIARAKQYYQTKFDLDVAAMSGFGATDAYAIGGLDASHAVQAFETIDQPGIEAFVVLGGNFPTLRYVEDWETRFGKPVVNTNQAALWAMLDTMNYRTPLLGLGRLLADLPSY
jgi:maleate isomerase